jgi:hypothetical protein
MAFGLGRRPTRSRTGPSADVLACHMIVFRHADARFPFLWQDASQPAARWHAEGEGPVHYLADTPDGAWAELLRYEGIRDAAELRGLRRAMWAVEIGEPPDVEPLLELKLLTGGLDTYESCREEARRLRTAGAEGLHAPSAALMPDGARGFRVDGGLKEGPQRQGLVIVLFGPRPDLVGWAAAAEGRPREDLLKRINHLH